MSDDLLNVDGQEGWRLARVQGGRAGRHDAEGEFLNMV